jgi:hypothetical protein
MDWGLMGRPLIWPGVRGPLLCPTGIPPGGIPVACPALVAICGYPPVYVPCRHRTRVSHPLAANHQQLRGRCE